MNAVAGGPLSAPAGEQLLWRGAPDPDRVARRWLASTLGSVAVQLVGLAIFLLFVGGAAQLGSAILWVVGFVLVARLVPTLLQLGHVRRDARQRTYVLTDQRLLIDGRRGRQDLRLTNLPDLRLELHGGGYGSISFTEPAGGGPQRYLRRLARWVPQREKESELLVSIPDAERVMGMLRKAQADAMASATSGPARSSTLAGAPFPGDAPVAYQPFMRSAAIVPFWFGGIFLAVGLGTLVLVAIIGPSGGSSWIPLSLVGALFALLGGLFVRARYLLFRDQRRLRAAGVRVTARVVDLSGTGTQVNDVEQWIVRYRFTVGDTEHTGQSSMVPWANAARYAPGDAVEIIYDPVNPSTSTIPGLAVR